MKHHGTIFTLDVPDDGQFPQAVKQAEVVAARAFGYGAPNPNLQTDVQFLACSDHGDVYMVHVTDPRLDETASIRLTQLAVLVGGGKQHALGKRVAIFGDGPARI